MVLTDLKIRRAFETFSILQKIPPKIFEKMKFYLQGVTVVRYSDFWRVYLLEGYIFQTSFILLTKSRVTKF